MLGLAFLYVLTLIAAAVLLKYAFSHLFRKEVYEELGPFIKIPACPNCDYSWRPLRGQVYCPNSVCRKCGSDLEITVGQYRVQWTKNFFGSKHKILGFERK